MSIAVLSPHLDDAVLSAWATLRDGRQTVVVNVFDGIPAEGTLSRWDRVTGASGSAARMRERLAEDRAALACAGVSSESLGLLENEYRAGPPDTGELAAALAGTVAGRAEVWAPAGIGGHPDHLAVRDWALRHVAGVPVRLYADVPYAVKHGWPSWVTGAEPEPHFSHDAWWARYLPQEAELTGAAHPLGEREAALKLAALEHYRTQVYALDGGPIRVLREPAVIGYEVSWLVTPP
jgi:LmbE family N-acetylglucosaminyl deacetylase